jgi:hypothetical protein
MQKWSLTNEVKSRSLFARIPMATSLGVKKASRAYTAGTWGKLVLAAGLLL